MGMGHAIKPRGLRTGGPCQPHLAISFQTGAGTMGLPQVPMCKAERTASNTSGFVESIGIQSGGILDQLRHWSSPAFSAGPDEDTGTGHSGTTRSPNVARSPWSNTVASHFMGILKLGDAVTRPSIQ